MSSEIYGNTGPDSRREPHAVTENATGRGAAGGQEPAPTGHLFLVASSHPVSDASCVRRGCGASSAVPLTAQRVPQEPGPVRESAPSLRTWPLTPVSLLTVTGKTRTTPVA